jgi:hypothetical protein
MDMTKISITSVLIIKENILFLEEWIDYHLYLGFDKIYLYDNSKVERKNAFNQNNMLLVPQKINKYGVNYDEIVNLNKDEISQIIENIIEKYCNKVIVIEWSPTDENGKVLHNQEEAHYDCLERLKRDSIDWCASIDIDEFITINSGKNDNIKDYINNLNKDVATVKISQLRFDSRFNNLNKPILTIDKNEFNDLDEHHSNKYIYKVANTYELSVHDSNGTGKKLHPRIDELCFNHYKLNFNDEWNKYKIVKSNINEGLLTKIKQNYENYEVNLILHRKNLHR